MTGELPNQGFANMEQDEESEYIQMDARTYNPALGRFMSVDPLFEAFPAQYAYSYSFKSPLSWSDPTGLAPEKEKKRDRVLGMDMEDFWIGYGLLMDAFNNLDNERAANYEAFHANIRASHDVMNSMYTPLGHPKHGYSEYPSMGDIGTATRYPGTINYVVSGGFVSCYGTNDPNDAVTYGKAFEDWGNSHPMENIDQLETSWGYNCQDIINEYNKGSTLLSVAYMKYLNSDLNLNFSVSHYRIIITGRGSKLKEVP